MGDELRLVRYNPKFREFGLVIHDGGTATLLIAYCPFCGEALPDSLRDRWFDLLSELGVESGDDEVPLPMLTDEWWTQTE